MRSLKCVSKARNGQEDRYGCHRIADVTVKMRWPRSKGDATARIHDGCNERMYDIPCIMHHESCPMIDTRESFLEVLTTGSDAGTTAGGGAATC